MEERSSFAGPVFEGKCGDSGVHLHFSLVRQNFVASASDHEHFPCLSNLGGESPRDVSSDDTAYWEVSLHRISGLKVGCYDGRACRRSECGVVRSGDSNRDRGARGPCE